MTRKFYHGTNNKSADSILNNGIDINKGRNDADFGLGFYMTEDFRQAQSWAKKLFGDDAAVVSFYADTSKLKEKIFTSSTDEWRNHVYSNRMRKQDLLADYDCISGPMLDGKSVGKIIYMARIRGMSIDDFYDAVGKNGFGQQTVFKSSRAIASLKFGSKEAD